MFVKLVCFSLYYSFGQIFLAFASSTKMFWFYLPFCFLLQFLQLKLKYFSNLFLLVNVLLYAIPLSCDRIVVIF